MAKFFQILCFTCFISVYSNAQVYRNLVFRGGGIRGIAYAGAIKVLEEKKMLADVRKVAGTSVGAIAGVFLCTGYNAKEIEEMMFDMKMQTFNDGHWFFLGGQKRMRKNYGWYKGERLEEWIGTLVEQKTGNAELTFKQLHELSLKDKRYKDLYITATNLSKQRAEVFNWQSFPNMSLKTAVRISISVPIYYGAVFLDKNAKVVKTPIKGENYDVYVDGGLLNNYPLDIFDSNGKVNNETLGFRLARPQQLSYLDSSVLAPYDIQSFGNYFGALYTLVIETLNKKMPMEQERFRTIYISNANISPRVRKISMEQKMMLYNNGREAAMEFFEKKLH